MTARDLRAFAQELGIRDLSVSTARALLSRYGVGGARRVVRHVREIQRASAGTVAPITTWTAARALYGYVGDDLDEAVHRASNVILDARGVPRRYTRAQTAVADAALAAGFEITRDTARAWVCKHGAAGAVRWVEQLGEVMDASAEIGPRWQWEGAAARVGERGAGAVLAELRDRRAARIARWSKACEVTILPRDRDKADDVLVACGCGRCEDRLSARTIGLQHTIASSFPGVPFDEALATIRHALTRAVEGWPHADHNMGYGFGAFLSGCARMDLRRLEERERLRAFASCSLDEPSGRSERMTVADYVHDERSVDPAFVVIWREQLAEAIEAWRDSRAQKAADYERGLVMA